MSGLFYNKTLGISLTAWAIAQLLKVIFVFIRDRKLDFTRLVGSGGMPSSHSSFVTALALSVGRQCGFNSPEFTICTVFALIVMYDAAGVRRAAGKQAKVLNAIIEDMQHTGKLPEEKLKELIGHTPVEVFAGAVVGIITSIII
jgi:Uncharacterized protein conserved in bacteria